jgi:diguanylate cyclase (GGDEF)-like protein/PAS domain S-box-containing protein
MQTLLRTGRALAVAPIAIAAATLLRLIAGASPADGLVPFAGLVVAAILVQAIGRPRTYTEHPSTMPAAFVLHLTSLLLLGPAATTILAIAEIASRRLAHPQQGALLRRSLLDAGALVLAIQAASLAHRVVDAIGQAPWGVAIAAATAGYWVALSGAAAFSARFVVNEPFDPSSLPKALRAFPRYVVGASIAAALAAGLAHQMWGMVSLALVPLFFVYKAYDDHLGRLEDEHRRRQAAESMDEAMAVLDVEGRVTLWDRALERIAGCSRERALGQPLLQAIPSLARTELPRALQEALTTRRPPPLVRVALPLAAGTRILQVKILPSTGTVTLLWRDETERVSAEQALRRREERLALAAEGANDGLWEWDLRSNEFFVSSRWKAIVGLAATAPIGRADDWLGRVHPDDVAAVKEAISAYVAGRSDRLEFDHRVRHENGSYRHFTCRGVACRTPRQRVARIGGSLSDTTEQAMAKERLRTAGFRDPLTGLLNRAVFVEMLGRRLDEFKRRRAAGGFGVLYLDLDRFKVVNDSLGHLVGDELLVAASRRLESCLRAGDALARLGGDEFTILLNQLDDWQQANAIAFRIQQSLSAPFSIGGREVFTSASIGIACGPAQYSNPDEVMRDADTAMYQAKARGKARHELFDADMHARTRDRLGLENDLRHAIQTNGCAVYYQPIVSLQSGMCVGFETLVRWNRNGEAVSPATFVPIAEELGLIEPLGTWVLEQACRTFAGWQRRFPSAGLDCITVNVSSRQLMQQTFPAIVEQTVQRAGLKACDLRLEITETALMDNPSAAADMLRQLRDFGVKIYLDDFGTGYSSLSHLHKLPVDALKIDRSFVKSLLLPDRPAIVESILALARTLNTSVVAEGIESDVQARELERLGCTHAQGFLFSRPLSSAAAEELIAADQPLGPKRPASNTVALPRPDVCYPTTPFEWPERLPA